MTLKRAFAVLIDWEDGLSNEARPVAADAGIEPGDVIVRPDAGGVWHKVAADSTDAEIATSEVALGFREAIAGSVVTAARHAILKDALVSLPADAAVKAKVLAAFERKMIRLHRTTVS